MNIDLTGLPRPHPAPQTAFDGIAADYDARFTHTLLGRLLRQRVWERLEARFPPGSRVLDIGCGTGEDAVYLARRGRHIVALDTSVRMLEAADRKAHDAGVADRVEVRHAALESLGSGEWQGSTFDGAYSSFGALNCCAIPFVQLAAALARRLRPGAPLVLVIMGPLVPWEWVWFLGRADARRAFRRLRNGRDGSVLWNGVQVRYPSARALRRWFAPEFRTLRVSGLGMLLPPSYAEGWAQRHPRLVHALARWERRLEPVPALASLGDHYILELERR